MLAWLIDLVLHLDRHLVELIARYDLWIYPILFAVIFCETGLVVTPFLPGDSLLFAIGTLCAQNGSPLSIELAVPLLMLAAVLGDTVNYFAGRQIGQRVFTSESSVFLNKKHLVRTQEFYERYGGK